MAKNIPTPEPFIGKSPRLLLITELGPRWNLRSLFNLSLLRFSHCLIFIAIYKQKLSAVESSKQFNAWSSINCLTYRDRDLLGLRTFSNRYFWKTFRQKISGTIFNWSKTLFLKTTKNISRKLLTYLESSLRSTFIFEPQGIIPGFSIRFCTITRCQTTDIIWIEYSQNI